MTQSNNQRKMQENFKQYWNPLKFKVLGKHIENQMYIQDLTKFIIIQLLTFGSSLYTYL